MTTTITAYTDLRSPYTYLAKAEAYSWEQEFSVKLDWLPYTTPLAAGFGPAEGRNDRQLRKIKYMYMNARRAGAKQGLTIYGTKRIFDPTPAHVGLLQAKDDGLFRPFHDIAFERVFKRELDPDTPEHVASLLDEIGGNVSAYHKRLDGDGPQELQELDQAAEAAGVFGVPSFLIDGELFWGTDTFPLIRDKLEKI